MTHPLSDKKARLLEMLTEDTGSSEDAEILLPIIMQIQQTDSVLDELKLAQTAQRAIEALRTNRRANSNIWQHIEDWYVFALLKMQLRIVQGEIWVASALIMLLGGVVTLLMSSSQPNSGDLPIVLIAPIVAAGGVSFLYSTDVEEAMEIEQATPTSPQVILLLRLTLVFSFNFVLGVLSSAALTLVNPSYSLAPLIMMWLAPMAFLSSLAFLLSVLFADAGVGLVISMLIWTIQALNRFLAHSGFSTLPLPDMLSAHTHVWLLIFAGVLLGAALWMTDYKHWIRRGWRW